jgi:hypothetical protein
MVASREPDRKDPTVHSSVLFYTANFRRIVMRAGQHGGCLVAWPFTRESRWRSRRKRQLDTFKIAIFRINGPISVEPPNAMWFSLTGKAKMLTQRQMLTALDAALSAQVNLLFSKMASAASGADPEGRFAEGIKNASSFYDKAADIIRNVVQERQAALAQPRRRRRQARTS